MTTDARLTRFANRMVFGGIYCRSNTGALTLDHGLDVALNMPAQPDRFECICHGRKDGYAAPLSPNGTQVLGSAVQVARAIRQHPGFTGQPVILIACWLARNGFAQCVADLLGVPVTAADDEIGFDDDEHPTCTRFVNDGHWHTFIPGC